MHSDTQTGVNKGALLTVNQHVSMIQLNSGFECGAGADLTEGGGSAKSACLILRGGKPLS